MMKTSLLCITLFLGTTLAIQDYLGFGDHDHSNGIDWCGGDDDECLCNKINLLGPKVVLINLDDHCLLEDIEDQGGIFLQTGDLLIVTGRNNASAFQTWAVTGHDSDVLGSGPGFGAGNAFDLTVNSTGGIQILQDFVIFVAEQTGSTTAIFEFRWGGMVVRRIAIDIYVNQEPALAFACPRECDRYEYTNMGNRHYD